MVGSLPEYPKAPRVVAVTPQGTVTFRSKNQATTSLLGNLFPKQPASRAKDPHRVKPRKMCPPRDSASAIGLPAKQPKEDALRPDSTR